MRPGFVPPVQGKEGSCIVIAGVLILGVQIACLFERRQGGLQLLSRNTLHPKCLPLRGRRRLQKHQIEHEQSHGPSIIALAFIGVYDMKTTSAALLALVFSGIVCAEITPAEERDIARWIIRLGGQVIVTGNEQPIGDPFDLPAGDFRIFVVDMHGTITEPKQLEPLSKLTHVRELYIPARVWSPVSDVKAPFADESFQYYQGMKELESFMRALPPLPGSTSATKESSGSRR